MGKTLYLECNSGISGDMTVAALLDLGADPDVLRSVLLSIPVSGFQIEIRRVKKAGLDVCDFHVKLDAEHENHDHDMEYLHGHTHPHTHGDANAHSHSHSHARQGDHDAHHTHVHRTLPDIKHLLAHAHMTERARSIALRIFDILAGAEAKAHGVPVDKVHFHEVGAVDSIVDIAAVAVCLDNLDVDEVIIPSLCEGQGTVRCQHGILSIPVPAVTEIVQTHGIQLKITEVEGELVTPTGAAIVAAIRTSDRLPEQFVIQKTGIGGGKREYERPSMLRAMFISPAGENKNDEIIKLETNIDDCTGEMLGHVMERLFENGARDVYYTPAFMKKNRPAYVLAVICTSESAETLENIIFQETTTIGIRRVKMERTVLQREMETVQLEAGEIKIKKCTLPDGTVRRYPEYETMAELAKRTGKALPEIMDEYGKWKRGV